MYAGDRAARNNREILMAVSLFHQVNPANSTVITRACG